MEMSKHLRKPGVAISSVRLKSNPKKISSLPRPSRQDAKNKTVLQPASSNSEKRPRVMSKSRDRLDHNSPDNSSSSSKHALGKELLRQRSLSAPPKQGKYKKEDLENLVSNQNEQFSTNGTINSSNASFDQEENPVSLTQEQNKVKEADAAQSAEITSDLYKTSLELHFSSSEDPSLSISPNEENKRLGASAKHVHCTPSHGAEKLCEQPHGCHTKPKQKQQESMQAHLTPFTPGTGRGNTKSFAHESLPVSAMTRRTSKVAILKDLHPKSRRCLSFFGESGTPSRGRPNSEAAINVFSNEEAVHGLDENNSSVDSLRNLNLELRDQVTKMRHQLEAQKGSIKHVQWQKVLDIRHMRQQEHEHLTLALAEQKEKFDKEKARELEHLRAQLTIKAEADLQKLTRHKDAEMTKLKLEVSCKDDMIQRLLGENRHATLKLNMDVRRSKLLDELKELRRQKKELEDSLSSSTSAERAFSDDLRRHSQNFETEIARVKRETQLEIKQMIEQLKNKDKLISQLEKDLGHQWVAAHLAALEREYSEGARGTAMSAFSHPLGALPEDSYDPNLYSWTPTSTPTTGGVEEEKSSTVGNYTPGKQDLSKKLKDKNKELVEKCRAYLQRNKELTAQNRAYKDSSEKVLQENKKMQELLEHSKFRVLQLSRNLSQAQAEKTNFERQTEREDELRQEMMEDKKTISALKQACANKDRRIELMQHRKKKRRLAGSAEKSMGVKETFFGYEEDTKSVDSENSFSSQSHSTFSDEDVWDEVLSMEETERNYQRLMMEHLHLERSHSQLQRQCEHIQDPQREALKKMTLQNDLFNAQCRIEKLEKLVNEIGEGEVITLLKERETIIANNKEYLEKAQFWEKEGRRVQHELNKALEKCEDLEFQLMEMEQVDEEKQSSTCEDNNQDSLLEHHELLERLAEIDHHQHVAVQEMEQLRKELIVLLKGKGREGDAALKRLDKITEEEKRRAESLESIARELQMKVISLQKEKDVLYGQMSHMGQKQGKGEQSIVMGMAAARERQENLELKNEVAQLSCSESKLLAERIHLYEQLEDLKTQCEYLKKELDMAHSQSQQTQSSPLKADVSDGFSSGNSSPNSSTSQLTRKPSKDRKSKPRSGDDPMETKRRRSSKDVPLSDDSHGGLKNVKSLGDIKSDFCQQNFMRSFKSTDDLKSASQSQDEIEMMKKSLRVTEAQLHQIKEDNFNLHDQLRQCALEKSSEAEADQQILLDKLEVLEAEVRLLRKENGALAQRLKQRMEEYQEELNPRVTELEDYCEDLQERLHASEMTERQLREKLRLVEQSINDAENSEIAIRDEYEQLLAREAESKKQIQELQRTGRELRDIVLDKDIVEQALRDKVDFLQKAEAASAKRIDELEAVEQELREQLEMRSDSRDSCQRELNKIQELKHQITFLESDNKALSSRIAELEENEEILRENWRRVADEDFNRTQCLEEKVKMLEVLNRDLKSKLTDAQEYFVINTVQSNENSLAAELAQSRAPRRAATFDDDDGDVDSVDGQDGGGSDSTETSQADTEKKTLKEKLKLLERQLSDVAEEKNSKIETLQEKIVSLKENEIKLTETIAELEMAERELRAKLALYESSEVTVEKMLKYQSRIEELRTSQESLLDQLESMENQGMTLQEKMQEMERTLRGKIVTLEVEMRGFKQKELKDAGRIRELEKQEKELSEKVTQQAEKENGLYVKISSLMDELKKAKEELSAVKTTMLEKEDKVRRANLLEVSFLEKDMENAKKISSLSTKLRHKEEELRQKEAAHEEEISSLQQELSDKESEKTKQVTMLEKLFAQKEKDLQATISSLSEDVKVLNSDRDDCMRQLKQLIDRNTDLSDKDIEYNKELDILRQEVASIKMSEKEYEEKIWHLQESLEKEKKKALEAENKVTSLEKELAKEKENVLIIENKIINLKGDIGEKMKTIELSFVEKESEYERQKFSLQEELRMKDERVQELEKELGDRLQYVRELEAECEELKSKAALNEEETNEKLADFGKILAEKDEELQTCLTEKEIEFKQQMLSWQLKFDALKEEVSEKNKMTEKLKQSIEFKEKEYKDKQSTALASQEASQNELRNKLQFLNTQLLHEAASREKDQSLLDEAEVREKMLSSEISELKKEVEQLRIHLTEKLSEHENKNRENCELSLELSSLRHSLKTLHQELENAKEISNQNEQKYQNQVTEHVKNLDTFQREHDVALKESQQLKLELLQKDKTIKDTQMFLEEKQQENKLLVEEKAQKEVVMQDHLQKSEFIMQKSELEYQSKEAELERLKRELYEKDALLEKQVSLQSEMNVQIQSLKEELENVSQKYNAKTSETEHYLQEIKMLKQQRETVSLEVAHLQKHIAEKHEEIDKRSTEQKGTELLVSSKQNELEQARTELQKCLQEIEKYKDKENEFNQQNQKCKEMSVDVESLNTQFKKQNEGYMQLESKVAHVELKLVEAENRYRELEAKCAKLEMQLQESFAQAHCAEKVIKNKQEECQHLEEKLTSMEEEFEATSLQLQEAEKIIIIKDKEFRKFESELEKVSKKYEELKSSMTEKEIQHQQLKSESNALHQKFTRTQSQHEDSQTEAKALKQKLSVLEEACEQAQNQLMASENRLKEMTFRCESVETNLKEIEIQKQDSEMKLAALQSEMKYFENQRNDIDAKLKKSEQFSIELEKTVDAKDNIIKSLQSEIQVIGLLSVEAKLNCDKAESDLKSKCSEFDSLSDKLRKTEQVLRISEENSYVLRGELNSAEEKLLQNSQSINELTTKISILEKALEEKESFCRDSQSDLCSLAQEHLDIKTECETLRSKVAYFEQRNENSQTLCISNEEKMKEVESQLEQIRLEFTNAENKLSETECSLTKIHSQLEDSQRCLNSSQEEVKHYEGQVNSLEETVKQASGVNKGLLVRNEELLQELENKEMICKDFTSQLEIVQRQADDLQCKLLQAVSSNESESDKLSESKQLYSSTLSELESLRQIMNSEISQSDEKCQRLQEEVHSKNLALENLKSSERELMSSISLLHQENASLKAKLDTVESSIHSNESYLSELIETNQTLSGKLYQAETKLSDDNKRVALLEQNLSKLSSERDYFISHVKQLEDEKKQLEIENTKLHEDRNKAEEKFQSLKSDFGMSKTSFELRFSEMSERKEDIENALKEIQTELIKKNDVIARLEQEIVDLKTSDSEIVNLKSQVFELERINNDMLQRLQEESRSSDIDTVNESDIFVSVSAELQSQSTSQVSLNDSTELRNKLSHFEDHSSETAVKMEKLLHEIETYKKADAANEEKLHILEKLLSDVREKELSMSERILQLETREKELLEQIADIEVTVIVPLETENQELKDEINVVKQERDDARSRISKWGDEDEDQQDVESVHKCLEDALIHRDELEKKIEILCRDVSKLEEEREKLLKKTIDLEAKEAEHIEKIEFLEDEVERLHGLEKATSVVEETETCLMDRVLDLEEKEQQLLAELEHLKNINSKSCSDQSDGQVSHENVLEKLKYLEQKNAVLQDAEGRYMDKIIELEEIQHRFQSEILSLRSSSSHSIYNGSTSSEPTFVSTDSVLLLMQNPTTHKNTTVAEVESQNLPCTSTSVSTDTADLRHQSEPTLNISDISFNISELENQVKNLTTENIEKTSKLKYLEEKCELLQDSEAKLMEKLVENDESGATMKTKSSKDDSELKKRLEHLIEENEFLAESVENFKQLYKEEKEKTNDLHDRFMDDTSIIQELHDTKAELKSTQQMVEEIQSEYEQQLSEREENEAHLSNLLALSQQREKDLQVQLIALQQCEAELQKKLNVLIKEGGNPQDFEKLMEEEKCEALRKLEENLKSYHHEREQQLQKQVQQLQSQQLVQQAELNERDIEHQNHLEDIQQNQQELLKRVDNLTAKELELQKLIKTFREREQDLLGQIDLLEKQLEEMKAKEEMSCDGPEEESIQSDSGMSADDQCTRNYNSEKSNSEQLLPLESSLKVFNSSLTLNLVQPSNSTPQKTSASFDENKSLFPEPVPPPRRGKTRQSSIDSISQEELVFLVEELQNREKALKKRLRELEAVSDSDLSQRIEELELENQNLERKLKYAESQINRTYMESPALVQESSKAIPFLGDSNNNNAGILEESLQDIKHLDKSVSSVLSSSSPHIMLDKPEDVLHKRIKDLENLDKHNKIQLSELERDREVLHEIARKDKATIHDLNVKIRELQLSEHSLRGQVNSLEVSESSLFTKCEDLEAVRVKLEDRVHELSVHERRLRELVRKLKLDEEHWLSKSGGMESAVAELAANEQQLKRLLQDVEMQKGGLSERAEYLDTRIQELENVEATLLQRLKTYETAEVNLHNKLIHLENSERAAYSKVSELDIINLDLSQRLQKSLEENVVLTQHISQLQGQVHELDRRLLSAQDSELACKQHMESVQKNESSLQKKVREYELQQIDYQARVRELEQVNDILNDKMVSLQRSENRLKFRIQELETVIGQGAELTATQKQKVPQKLEDCQKHIVFLQNQVDSLQMHLREVQKTTQIKLASKTDDMKKVSMSVDEYRQLQTKSALLEETMYQMEELETANRELSETILQLRQGKGASGHEVEIEVFKRRLASYKTFINKLKSSLSMGQATSLWDPEFDSGLQGDTLPARQIHGLESERVLQSVRGLQEGKADASNERGAQQFGLATEKDSIVQSKATLILSSRPASVDLDDDSGSSKSEQASNEESHWRAIEARKPKLVASSRGGAIATVGTVAKQAPPTHPDGSNWSLTPEMEEVMIGLHLQSESELSSHHRTTQNDTDSSNSPVPPPRRVRAHRAGKSTKSNNINSSGNESSDSAVTDIDTPAKIAVATNKKHYFGTDKSLPSPANKNTSEEHLQKRAPLTRFGEDSFYLPSSTQEGVDSLDDVEAPPLPIAGPPGAERLLPSPRSADGLKERKDSLDSSASGISIRDRIALIEKQFQIDKHGDKVDDDQMSYWKRKASEGLKQVDLMEKDNKSLKDEINRLEKELEEKYRYINLFELWLSNLEELLKNKNKQTDRHLIEQLHRELTKLRSELRQIGYRSDDAVLDPAALRTELEHRNKEIVSKRQEIDYLTSQLKRCQQECRSIEGMRQTTLDCLRALEHELVDLHIKEKHLQETQAELHALRTQYEQKCKDLKKVMTERNELELTLKKTILERDHMKCDLKKAEEEKDVMKPVVEELSKKVEDLSRIEARKSSLEDQLNSLNSLLITRTEKTKEVYEENLILRDHVHQNEAELLRLRNLCDDFNNLSARYDEMENYKQQAVKMLEPLQAKLERLARKCQEKDTLLRRLGAELRRSTYRPSSALDDLVQHERIMSQEEYNTDFPQVVNGSTLLMPERHGGYSPSSLDEMELNYPTSDTDSLPASTSKRKRPTPYVSNRPRSAETLGSGPRFQRGAHAHPCSIIEVRRTRTQPQILELEVSKGHFVAIADYDPTIFSQSGRPGLELELREGELVHVTGPMDRTGYYEAEVNGRIGLVPANYLQPLHGSSHLTDYNSDPWLSQSQHVHRPEEQIDLYRHMHQEPPQQVRDGEYNQNMPRTGRNGQSSATQKSSNLQGLFPDPPSNLHIKNIVNECSILLSWLPPRLDNKGNNNGMKLLGYKVYLDNQEYMHILNPKICEIVMEDINLGQPHHLVAVQCLYAGGHISQRIELAFEGIVRMIQEQERVERASDRDDLDTDLSSVLSSAHYKRGQRKTVIALYDYNPEQQSPLDYTSFELAFQAGQVIHIYGEPRPDGFFHGEIEDKRGLVPACFVEDISERNLPSSKKGN